MEDLLNNQNEILSIKSRIIAELPNINNIIKDLLSQIDPALFNTLDEFKRKIQSELTKSISIANGSTSDSTDTASVDKIDEFFRDFNYETLQPVTDKPSSKGRKTARTQLVQHGSAKSLLELRLITGSHCSLTPSTSMSGTTSAQNLNSLTYEHDQSEIDRTALKKITEIELNSQFKENLSINYDSEVEQFRESCTQLDQFLNQLKTPKEENIKTLTINPETNRLAAELNKAVKNLISILHIDLKQANNIFECDGDPFPLYEVLTELYQVL